MSVECQVCGRPAVGEGKVEGTKVPLCENCSAYSGEFTVYKNAFPAPKPKSFQYSSYSSGQARQQPAPRAAQGEMELAEDFGKRIMQARGRQGLSRKDLAKKMLIQEKELEGFEQQKFKPGEAIVKKLEFALGIKLRESVE